MGRIQRPRLFSARRSLVDGQLVRVHRAMHRSLHTLKLQRARGRAYQPQFALGQIALSWIGALLAITVLSLISSWSHYLLLAAPMGASSVLLFGYPLSPLAQPRNIILGNTLAAVISVVLVGLHGPNLLSGGLAVGLTIFLGQWFRCLHPPAGGVALLGVFLQARPGFILFPVASGSIALVAMALVFSRLVRSPRPYPHHWF